MGIRLFFAREPKKERELMKKKMLAVLLAASMVASMTACGSSNSADTTTTEEGTNESTDGAEAAADVSDLKTPLQQQRRLATAQNRPGRQKQTQKTLPNSKSA